MNRELTSRRSTFGFHSFGNGFAVGWCTAALAFVFGIAPLSLAQSSAQNQAAPAPPPSQQPADNPPPPPPGGRGAEVQQAPPAPIPAGTPAPPMLTLPAGTVIPVRVSQWLSSDRNHPGDTFSATLDQPLVANGWVVARRGQSIIGHVAVAKKAEHGKDNSELGLVVDQLILVDGEQLPVTTQLVNSLPRDSRGGADRKVGTVAATTVIGVTIGAIAGGGTGAAVGAGVGASAGIAGVMSTRGGPTVVSPETLLTFHLQSPLDISTQQGQVAFHPASQGDYGRDQGAYRPVPGRRYVNGPGYPPPYAYVYGPWAYYPYPVPLYYGYYGGFYGRYGFGGFRR